MVVVHPPLYRIYFDGFALISKGAEQVGIRITHFPAVATTWDMAREGQIEVWIRVNCNF